MPYLKQSTATTLKIGPFLDETTGKDAETTLTIAQADVRVSKNGADIIQKNESTTCTHDEIGIYGCPIDITDTDTLGRFQLWVHESGALPVWHEYTIVSANVYDSMIVGTDKLQVDTVELSSVAAASVNAEVVDVMTTDVTTEMAQVAPPEEPTFQEMWAYLYFRLRNKCTTTATEDAMWDNAGTTKLVKAAISDDGTTLTKGEYTAGP